MDSLYFLVKPFVPKETTDDAECDPHQSKSDNTSDSRSVQDDSDLEMGTLDHVSESTMDDVDKAKPNMPTKGTEEDEVKETSQLSVENQDSETINEDKDIKTAVYPAKDTTAKATEEDHLTEKEPKDDAQHKITCAICIADYGMFSVMTSYIYRFTWTHLNYYVSHCLINLCLFRGGRNGGHRNDLFASIPYGVSSGLVGQA
jgi:hypothetical protein